ncbi:MAG: nitrilase-related carbon-nitrogen hydrolase [candidate division WOR-3 bacterium]
MRILLIQNNPKGNKFENFNEIKSIINSINLKLDFVALPELWTTGYKLKPYLEQSESENSQILKNLSKLAKEKSCYILAGSIFFKEGENYYNRSFLFDRNGNIIGHYSKMKLFKGLNEHLIFKPGDKFGIFDIEFCKVGVMICYDLRFPEIARKLTFEGAKIIFVPSHWPISRIEHFKLLIKARAIENQLFVIGINRYGLENENFFGGNSLVISPRGEIILDMGIGEKFAVVEIDLDEVDEYRKSFPVLND